jgi:hypothetical protein
MLHTNFQLNPTLTAYTAYQQQEHQKIVDKIVFDACVQAGVNIVS